MYKKYSLGTFFLLITLFLIFVIGLISYGWRRNAPMQVWENHGHRYHSWFKQKGVDVYAPYYQTDASAKLEPHQGVYLIDSDGADFPSSGLFDSVGYPGQIYQNNNPHAIAPPAIINGTKK